jgi:hypothetical protein
MKNKIKAILAALALLTASNAVALDAFPLYSVTLAPGETKTLTYDLRGAWFGVQNYSIFVTQPRTRTGRQNILPDNTPITVTAVDLTTGAPAEGWTWYWWFDGNVGGHLLEVTLTLAPSAKKTLTVEVSSYGALGGPPATL